MTDLREMRDVLAEWEELAQNEGIMNKNPEIRIYMNFMRYIILLEKRISLLEDVARITRDEQGIMVRCQQWLDEEAAKGRFGNDG